MSCKEPIVVTEIVQSRHKKKKERAKNVETTLKAHT